MSQFVVDFKTADDLREAWHSQLSAGMCFIATSNLFPLGSNFNLVLRVPQLQKVLIIPARVVRLESNAPPPRQKGMVTQFLGFQGYEPQLRRAILDLDTPSSTMQVTDFSSLITDETKVNKQYEEKARTLLTLLKTKNLYEILNVSPSIGFNELKKTMETFSKTFLVGKDLKTSDPELNKLKFETDQQIKKLFLLVDDSAKRTKYDIQHNVAVQNNDDSQADYQRKKVMATLVKVKENNKESVEKADRMFKDAEVALREGDVQSALKNIRIASMYDPLNTFYKDRMNDLEKRFNREFRKTGAGKMTKAQAQQFTLEIRTLIQDRASAWGDT